MRTLLSLVLAVLYGALAIVAFGVSGVFGDFGERWWWDLALIVVTVIAAVSLTHVSLVLLWFLGERRKPRNTAGDPSALSWHLLVPCRDEESVIAATVSAARTSFPGADVWVIDDASEDATATRVRELMVFDPHVHLISRIKPEARTGKGDALNAAYRVVSDHVGTDPSARSSCVVGVLDADGYLSDNTLGLLAGPESFGDVSVGAVQLEVWMKNRGDRRPRGEDGPWRNRLGRLLVRMQDLEFRTTNSAMQVLRRRAGTVGLGGNGQFTRLSVLDELVEKHDRPWGKKLCEDYELGLNVLELGQRTHYVSEAHVSQEALPYLRRLLTQRTRWAQGNMECASHLGALRRSGHLRPAGLLEIHHFMAQPLLVMLNLFLIPLLTVLTILEHGTAAWTPGSVVILVVTVCCFLLLPYAIWGPVYRWVTGGEVPALTALALGLVNVVYVYLTYIYYVRATWRSLTGRTSWTKTRRNADGRRHAPIEVPTSVTALRLVHPATLDALTEELEGNTEFVSAFAVMWPTRLARLELAIGEENPVAIRDAAGSLRISSSMVGAEQLASVAELVEQRLETDDMEGCRTLLGLVTDVGTRTMTALREELSTVQPAPQQREFRSLDAIIESRRATPA